MFSRFGSFVVHHPLNPDNFRARNIQNHDHWIDQYHVIIRGHAVYHFHSGQKPQKPSSQKLHYFGSPGLFVERPQFVYAKLLL